MRKPVRWRVPQWAAAVLLAAVSATSIRSQSTVLEIDAAATKVEFTLSAALHTVHGTFALKRGNFRFDAATGKAAGELVVDARSGDSGSPGRDRRMHSQVLESERYPEIVFRPDRLEGRIASEGTSQVQVHGIFSIHGAEHEIVLPVEVEAAGGRYTATAKLTVPYAKWGMKNPSTLFLRVSDRVELSIRTTARPAP